MKLHFTKSFVRRYKKLDFQSQKAIIKSLEKLKVDYTLPSLRAKKMKGYRNPDIWEISATMDLRITFHYDTKESNTIVLRNCGHHDRTLNNP